MFVPPEMMGAHIGPRHAHTTGRVHSLAFRVATAMFGHLGVECDLMALDARERSQLAAAITLHQRFRSVLHNGDTVRFDTEEPYLAHVVHAADRHEAVVCWSVLGTPRSLTRPPLRLPGLDPDRRYRLVLVELPGGRLDGARRQPGWLDDGLAITGRQLAVHGFCPPTLDPQSAVLFHLT